MEPIDEPEPEDIDDDDDVEDGPTLAEGLQALPLLGDDIYLRMQAFNLAVVDALITEWEGSLIAEYHATDKLPTPTMTTVSAMSQLWVFGLYELLRIWRQRGREVTAFAESVAGLGDAERLTKLSELGTRLTGLSTQIVEYGPFHLEPFQRATQDQHFVAALAGALDRSEWPFRKLEALRIQLAKHEIPKVKGSFSISPGYSRIDEVSRSICWQVDLGNMEAMIISRRSVADSCARFGSDTSVVILPANIQQMIRSLPSHSYGVKRVTLVLSDGSEHVGFVGWNRQLLHLVGLQAEAIDIAAIVHVRHAPLGPAA